MTISREQIIVNGVVQGIGFRPAVYALALKHKLTGTVSNTSQGVVIEVQGSDTAVGSFVSELPAMPLNKLKIDSLDRQFLELVKGEVGFIIEKTSDQGTGRTFMPPDMAVCDACRSDLQNRKDKRHHHYFLTACTQCGPRFSVIQKLPYHRPDTTMAPYTMCPACLEEYEKPVSRRFNFETNTCAACGPELHLIDSRNGKKLTDPIATAQRLLAEGKILAIKGVGGYHIAVDATNEQAVQTLRDRKYRPDKPFAVMFRDVEMLRQYAEVSGEEAAILTSLESPILLVGKRTPPGPPLAGGQSNDHLEQEGESGPPDKGEKGGLSPSGFIPYDKSLTKKAQENRKNPTPAEKAIWYEVLSSKQMSQFKFVRQKPLGSYIVDFYCAALKLVIEVDGDPHAEQVSYDAERTRDLGLFGVRVVRFANRDVLTNLEGVFEELMRVIDECGKTPLRPIGCQERPPFVPPWQGGNSCPLAPGVAPGQATIGAMLPYAPLQMLLVDRPLVMTSANLSGQPMFYRDSEVREHLKGVVDFILYHDREIVINVDDSVGRVVLQLSNEATKQRSKGALTLALSHGMGEGESKRNPPNPPFIKGELQLIRRSRGYVPEALALPRGLHRRTLCFGAQQKNTFCLGFSDRAVLSQHNGDLDTLESQEAFDRSLRHMMKVFSFHPELIVADMHPEYASSRFARRMAEAMEIPYIEVQHHKAHVMSGVLEQDLLHEPRTRLLGVAFDGTGYGQDDTIWGGELFTVDHGAIERVGHLERVQMPGGEYAVREPYRMMLSYLWQTFGDQRIDNFFREGVSNQVFQGVWELVKSGRSGIETSSMGRLFDAVAALVTGRHSVTYEGQAAMEFETLALSGNPRVVPLPIAIQKESGKIVLTTGDLFTTVLKRLSNGVKAEDIALAFRKGVADAITEASVFAKEHLGTQGVLLTGGVFQNRLLCQLVRDRLRKAKIPCYEHRLIPMNDGGIALGQLGYVLTYGIDQR